MRTEQATGDWITGNAPNPLLRRTPPNSAEAERCVIAACFDAFKGFDELEVTLQPSDFYSVWHRTVWESMVSLRERRIPIDNVSVKNDLQRRGVALTSDRETDLVLLEMETVPTAANLNYYARIVLAMNQKRALIETGARIVELGYSAGKVRDVQSAAHELLFSATSNRTAQEIVDGAQLAREVYDHIDNPNRDPGIVSGFFALDEVVQCFRPGEMSILAARPSMGKSALMVSLCASMIGKGYQVGIASLEMNRLQLGCNAVGSRVGVDTTRIRRGVFGEVEPGRYDEELATRERRLTLDGIEWLSNFGDKFAVFDGDVTSITELGRVLERMVMRNKIRFAAIDYMQLLDGSEATRGKGRYEETTEVSKGIKRLAKRLDIHVMCCAQLNRKVEERTNKRPVMADLRDSGQVEQDADVIMLLHRPEYYTPDKEDVQGVALLDVCKNRNGPTGMVRLRFVKQFTRFEPW